MNIPDSYVQGTVFYPESKEKFAQVLIGSGFAVTVGQWALRLDDCARNFEIGYVGNITPEAPFQVEGDGYGVSVDSVAKCCERLAKCLKESRIGYDFMHVTHQDEVICEYQFAP